MMGKMSREKGKRGERMAAKELKKLGIEARRAQQYCGEAGDADLITDVEGLHFEVKNVERFNLHAALEQAERDKRDGEVSVVLHKRNGKRLVVIHYLEDWDKVTLSLPFEKGGDDAG